MTARLDTGLCTFLGVMAMVAADLALIAAIHSF